MNRFFTLLAVTILAIFSANFVGAITVDPWWMIQQSLSEAPAASRTLQLNNIASPGASLTAALDPAARNGSSTQDFEIRNASVAQIVSAGVGSFSGFVNLGAGSPVFKMVEIVGNAANGKQTVEAGQRAILHGLDISKILNVQVVLSSSTTSAVFGPNIGELGPTYNWYYYLDSDELRVGTAAGATGVYFYDIHCFIFYGQ